VAGQTEIGSIWRRGPPRFLFGPLLEGPLHHAQAGRAARAKAGDHLARQASFEASDHRSGRPGPPAGADVRPGRRPAQWHPMLQTGLAAGLKTLAAPRQQAFQGLHPQGNKGSTRLGKIVPSAARSVPAKPVRTNGRLLIPGLGRSLWHCCCA